MKKLSFKRVTSLLIAIILAMPVGITGLTEEADNASIYAVDEANTYALDEAVESTANDVVVLNDSAANDTDSDDTIVSADDVDPEVGETNDLELGGEDEPASDDVGSMTTYRFLVNDELFSEQTVEDGEALIQPEDPEAPEGMAFSGWFLENGMQLFTEGAETAMAGVSLVNVLARFEVTSDEDAETNVPGDKEITTGAEISDAPVENETGDTPVENGDPDEAVPGDNENSAFDETGDDDDVADPQDAADPESDAEKDENDDAEGVNVDAASDKESKEGADGANDENNEGEGTPDKDGENNPDDEDETAPDGDGETDPDEDSDAEDTPDDEADETPAETVPVRVAFTAVPEDAVVSVYAASQEETEETEETEGESDEDGEAEESAGKQGEFIIAKEDGSWLLLPGEYAYSASAEGYVSIENIPFTVTDEPLEIAFELEPEAIEEPEESVPFDQSKTLNGVVVRVQAEAGVFPADAELSVSRVPVMKRREAEEAIEEVRDEDVNVAVSYTFDIKVVDPDTREELQPAEGQSVSVSFALEEVADENLETAVYHVTEEAGELTAEELEVTGEDTIATIETDGFSIYTVEFTYENLEYVMQGDTSVALSEILAEVGLTGEVMAVEINDESLFSASDESGAWIVTAHRAFSSKEWMKVTINGVVYEITVTDQQLFIVYIAVSTEKLITLEVEPGDSTDNVKAKIEDKINVSANQQVLYYNGTLVENAHTLADYDIQKNATLNLVIRDGATYAIAIAAGIENGTVTANTDTAYPNEPVTLTVIPETGYALDSLTYTYGDTTTDIKDAKSFTMPAATVTIKATFKPYICYVDAAGVTQEAVFCENIDSTSPLWYRNWYAVIADTEIPYRVEVEGDVNLILCDGATLTISKGIHVKDGKSLTVWTQTTGNNKGALTINGCGEHYAGIGSNAGENAGTITVNGGAITVNGGKYGAGIGGGSGGSGGVITINGGVVTANGGENGAGIGGGDDGEGGSITINGGEVKAFGLGNSAGIGGGEDAGGGSITINGGECTARGGWNGAGIGGGDMGAGGVIEINEGRVTAQGGCAGAGIGGGDIGAGGSITINGGRVKAIGGSEAVAAIGGEGGAIIINGGQVEVDAVESNTGCIGTGEGDEDYDPGTVILGWTNPTDFIKADGYSGAVTVAKHFDVMVNDTIRTAILPTGAVKASEIEGKTLRPRVGWLVNAADTRIEIDNDNATKVTVGGKDYYFRAKDAEVTLTVTPGESAILDTLSVKQGKEDVTYSGAGNTYTFTMPEGDVTVSATFKPYIRYVDAVGRTQGPQLCENIEDTTAVWNGGWYAVTENTSISSRIEVSGSVNLILCDDATLTIPKGIHVEEGNSLAVWAQSTGDRKGALTINSVEHGSAGIGGDVYKAAGTITINGGTVNVTSSWYGAGIGGGHYGAGGSITVNGGTITANGGNGAAGIGGGYYGAGGIITVNGGTITANSGTVTTNGVHSGAGIGSGGYGKGGSIEIIGGHVTATGGENGAGIGCGKDGSGGTVSLGWTNATDFITASSYSGTVTAARGLITDETSDPISSGAISELLALAGKKLVPAWEVKSAESIKNGTVAANPAIFRVGTVTDESTVDLAFAPDIGYKVDTVKYNNGEDHLLKVDGDAYSFPMSECDVTVTATFAQIDYDITIQSATNGSIAAKVGETDNVTTAHYGDIVTLTIKPDANAALFGVKVTGAQLSALTFPATSETTCTFTMPADAVTVSAVILKKESVNYVDEKGAAQSLRDAYIMVSDAYRLPGGWYAVSENTTIENRIEITGSVNLILCNGATLTTSKGIHVKNGNSLTIWAQSIGDNKGVLTINGVDDCNAGIGGSGYETGGTVTINGGTVTVTGGKYCAGIGGGYCDSEGGAGGNITVNGGTVNANGGEEGAGIGGAKYGAGGNITINGGTVTATGGKDGAGIGGGNGGDGGIITINGGTVNANSGQFAAGIGGGYYAAGGEITVSGGVIEVTGIVFEANGRSYVTGIGAGYEGSGGTLTVGFDNASDSLTATSYDCAVTVAENMVLTDGSAYYAGELSDAEKSTIVGKTLRKTDTAHIIHVNEVENGSITPSAKAAAPNTQITLTVAPDTGYALDTLTYTYGVATTDITEARSFTMPTADVTVTATFALIDYDIAIQPATNGSVAASVGETNPAETAHYGDTVTLTGMPDIGYMLESATVKQGETAVTVNGTGNTRAFTMPAGDVTVTATFVTEWSLLKAQFTAGGDITLDRDYTCVDQSEGPLVVGNAAVTLDLNGHKIDRNLTGAVADGNVITVDGNLTVTDSGTGGSITGGFNDGKGGGVYVRSGTFNVSGAPVITGNKQGTGDSAEESNVYLSVGTTIDVAGVLSPDASIGVTLENNHDPVFTTGLSGSGNDLNFLSDDTNYAVGLKNNEAVLATAVNGTFHANDGSGETKVIGIASGDDITATLRGDLFTNAGRTFKCWSTAQDGTGDTYKAGEAISVDRTGIELYAQWYTNVTLTANSGAYTYDGGQKTVIGFTPSVSGLIFPGVTASGSGINPGTYPVTFSGITVNETEDSTGQYLVTKTVNGKLTINPAPAPAPAPVVAPAPAPAPVQPSITIPKVPASVKAKAKKNKVTVSWKKIKKTKKTKALLAQIKGIEVQYSTDPTFASDVNTKKVGKKKTKVTLKLQKKTVYYIRVRYTDGAGGVSNWSKVRKVKTK